MKKLSLSLLLAILLSPAAYALSTDSEQPVYIDSDSQQLDMKSNKVTFIGDVVMRQGSIHVQGDKVIVFRNPKDGAIEKIEAFGELAKFSQKTDDGKTIHGHAEELYYDMAADQLTMIKKAMLAQDDSTINGERIKYHITTEKMVAEGGKGSRVSTVLQPQPKENK
ncbi:lipopolysaccharide transport periplasmic protein LptA [Vibrio sp. UCD-FRSSP16_10]|uniref:lipopolysaccharide transport periplasmic protein LptA n=1 Tax=unclassified Vibrio TaxID=2614977 RepID=UPI0007FF1323|nr:MULTISPECIES: lipopolysaccharide transport periplasmic protein LptA [unclassified Vibrio]OBT17419.1 lipopolysaccharide transport periplasmic protein LptA [Vibrio sp. UCD-FRSSP16_30]OBT23188.1 lipopolysaccharide transport periplasmic protein LptA [Vibrio sp. UCD-FRSSP16_10]